MSDVLPFCGRDAQKWLSNGAHATSMPAHPLWSAEYSVSEYNVSASMLQQGLQKVA